MQLRAREQQVEELTSKEAAAHKLNHHLMQLQNQ